MVELFNKILFKKQSAKCTNPRTMQGNSKRLINYFQFTHNQTGARFPIFNHHQALPIIAHLKQFPGSHKKTASHVPASDRPSVINEKPFNHCSESYDQNSRLNSPGSVIINFDYNNEPSTSHSVELYGVHTTTSHPERFQQNVSLFESVGISEHENFSNSSIQRSTTTPNHSSSHNRPNPDNNYNNNISFNDSDGGRHTENPNLNAGSGTQSFEKISYKYIPFITFLLLKVIYDHREGILIFLGLVITFFHANSVVKREIAKQSRRSFISLGIIFMNLLVSICCICFVFQEQQLYKIMVFIPTYNQSITIWNMLWILAITDFILKFITIQLKVGITCIPGKLLPFTARGKWYLMLECTSQLYRALIPIQLWLYYLMEVYQGPESMIGMFFSIAYLVLKGSDIVSKVKIFSRAFWKVLNKPSFGIHPSNEQLITSEPLCPICHDEYCSPIILQCRHIFCESCVSAWFDREQTCPLCRAKIADDPSWRDGATAIFMQLF